jgi:hypothetical protein
MRRAKDVSRFFGDFGGAFVGLDDVGVEEEAAEGVGLGGDFIQLDDDLAAGKTGEMSWRRIQRGSFWGTLYWRSKRGKAMWMGRGTGELCNQIWREMSETYIGGDG